MSFESFSSPDAILHVPPNTLHPTSPRNNNVPTIIFFLTGNPGLISYYDEFLALIAQSYDTAESQHGHDPDKSSDFVGQDPIVAGFSLGGFATSSGSECASGSTGKSSLEYELTFPPRFDRKEIYTLDGQIGLCYARLWYLVGRVREHYDSIYSTSNTTTATTSNITISTATTVTGSNISDRHDTSREARPVKVILIGHSVGAYIALELIRLHHTQLQLQSSTDTDPTTTSSHPPSPSLAFRIISSLLLTPTILNISSSPSGRIATPLLSYLPFFPVLLETLSSSLTSLISRPRLTWLVSKVTGMKEGSQGSEATVGFLRCKGAVRQALCMAREEMRRIGGDEWGREVWGVVNEGMEGDKVRGEKEGKGGEGEWVAPRLFFLFAERDHWVADLTRDEIVERFKAGREDGGSSGSAVGKARQRATVVVDETNGLVHAWCLEQSEVVARRVRGWIREVLDESR